MHQKYKIVVGFCYLIFALSGCIQQEPKVLLEGVKQVGPSGEGFQNPVWSPDGTKIAVTAQTVVQSWTSEIVMLDVLTGKKKSILYTDNGSVMAISWSPDGNQILLASQNGGDWTEGLWTLDTDGESSAKFLADGYDGDWSPDGEKIAVFSHSKESAHQDVMLNIIDLETGTGNVAFGGKSSNMSGSDVQWSPSGEELIFNYGPLGARQLDLYILNVYTGVTTKISGNGENYDPSWEPNGNRIVYINDPDTDNDSSMFIADKKNGCQQKLLTLDNLWGSAWSPDGKVIAFVSHGDVYLLDLEDVLAHKPVCP